MKCSAYWYHCSGCKFCALMCLASFLFSFFFSQVSEKGSVLSRARFISGHVAPALPQGCCYPQLPLHFHRALVTHNCPCTSTGLLLPTTAPALPQGSCYPQLPLHFHRALVTHNCPCTSTGLLLPTTAPALPQGCCYPQLPLHFHRALVTHNCPCTSTGLLLPTTAPAVSTCQLFLCVLFSPLFCTHRRFPRWGNPVTLPGYSCSIARVVLPSLIRSSQYSVLRHTGYNSGTSVNFVKAPGETDPALLQFPTA